MNKHLKRAWMALWLAASVGWVSAILDVDHAARHWVFFAVVTVLAGVAFAVPTLRRKREES